MNARIVLMTAVLAIIASVTTIVGHAATTTSRKGIEPAEAADPHDVLGNESCIKCHAPEIRVWKNTPHAMTFEQLHRRPEAKTIAKKLGLSSIKHSGRCVSCHYTQQVSDSGDVHTIAGVSCESCHGAAKDWIDRHHDYGGDGITRLSESSAHRQQRIAQSVAAGMRNPANVYSVAQSCLRCHTTADEELVNVGGHSAGSLDFEFVSWSQGLVRHNFVRSDGKTNELSSPERLRQMFVAGMIAELEASLRATAIATEKATYGITAAKLAAARAGARLKSVSDKVDVPLIDEIVARFESVKLQLNNRLQLTDAADQIAFLGYQFADSSMADLSPLDRFLPNSDHYK